MKPSSRVCELIPAVEQMADKEDLVFEGAVLRMEKKTDYLQRKKVSRLNGTKAEAVKFRWQRRAEARKYTY